MSEVYVFGIMDVIQLEPDEFTMAFAKSKIDCPRCKRFIEKAEKLLTSCSLLKKQDVAGICDHCWRQLARIQKLTRLTKGQEGVLATLQSDSLETQIAQGKRLYEGEVKELKERATTLGALTSQPYSSEGKAKDKTFREESKARGEKPTTLEESLRTTNKISNARDEKLIASEDSLREVDGKLILGKESVSAKNKMRRTRDGKLMGKETRTSMEEALGARDKKSKVGYESVASQEDQFTARDKKTKLGVEKPISQDLLLSTRDKKSKARDEKMTAQGESLRTKDDRSTANDELLASKDVKTKARGEILTSLEEALRARNKKSKLGDEKQTSQEEQLSTRDKKTKLGGEKLVLQDVPLSTRDKKLKTRDEKKLGQGELLKERDRKSVTREVSPTAKEIKFKEIDEKMLDTKDKKLKTKDANIKQEQEPTTKDKKSKTRDEQPTANDESLNAKDKKSRAKNDKSIAKDEEPKSRDNKSKVKDEKPVTKEESKAKEEKPLRVSTSTEQLKALIAQEKLRKEKEKLEAENRKKQMEQEKKLLELAEKRAKEAALQQEKEAKAKFQPPVLPVLESEDAVELGPAYPVQKLPVVGDIIIGETICKIKKRHDKDDDLNAIGKISTQILGKEKAPTVQSEKRGPPAEGLESSRKRKIAELELPVKVPVLGEEKPKKGAVLESDKTEKISGVKVTKKSKKESEEANDNLRNDDRRIRYALSDPTFIDKGWTKLPLEKVVRKINVYRMRPSKPEFDWFEHHKNSVLEYDTGERLAEVDDSGRGRWYYRSGGLAMDYYDAEEKNAGQRFVVYSSDATDARGRPRPRTVLATFDHSGNGIVFDHAGKTRLKYNQTEGIVLDQEIGPVSHWKWHTLNDPPVLQQVMIDTQLSHKDPEIERLGPKENPRPQDGAMLTIEHDNNVKEKSKKLTQKFKPFQIKMKALKINENFSLRVLDQASVYLLYRDGTTNLKINIGMLLDHKEIVDTDASDIGNVASKMETLPAHTASILGLQQSVAQARAYAAAARARRARLAGVPEGQLNHVDSVDALRAGVSRPLRAPLAPCSASAPHATLKPCPCDV